MFIVMVQWNVKPNKVDEFLEASKGDGRGSVTHEYGCHRFDVIQDSTDPTRIGFTEVYDSEEAFNVHTTQEHFKVWAEAVKDLHDGSPKVSKCRNAFPNDYAVWPAAISGRDESFFSGSLHIIHAALPVLADKVDDFIEAATLDALGSVHQEPGCHRFDLYQNIENPSELWLYEVYANAEAFEYHRQTPHIKKWADSVKDWYDGERAPAIRGTNIWPPDDWNWSTGKPTA
jgi:autoinducer 2-degrading protein